MFANVRPLCVGCATVTLVLAGAIIARSAEPGQESARLDTTTKSGESFFALSLSPTVPRPAAKPRDVVILFDTSASQTGAYRDKAFSALDATLAALSPTDKVRLFAVDLNAIPLMESFAAANSAETRAALASLRSRVPLGATDMAGALTASADAFGGVQGTARGRAALYIGDGMSTANLLASETLRPLVARLTEERVPVSSYAIGPRIDSPLLACLANQTGGVMAVDGENLTGAQVGNWLAAAVEAPVVWPKTVVMPESLHSVAGDRALPLRFDRDTVLVGQGQLSAPATVKMNVDNDGQSSELAWQVAPSAPNTDFAFLAPLVESAKRDGGLTLPTLGTQGLNEVRRMFVDDAQGLNRLGRVALASGDTEQAKRLAEQALAANGADAEASAILRLADQQAKSGAAIPAMKFAALQDGATEDAPAPAAEEADGGLLDAVDRDRRVLQQAIQTEVRTTINEARSQMATAPEAVIDILKLELEHVRKATELDAGQRTQLAGQLETALQDASRRAAEQVERDLRQQEIQAEADARKQLNRELVINQQKADQLLARFESLLDENQFRAAEEVADQARAILPALRNTPEPGDATATFASPLVARTMGYTYDMRELVRRRQKGVVESLYAVEVAHVPQSDEPPIIYPSAEEWMLKTERRKKYAESVSLYQPGSSEEKIYRELGNSTDLEFADTPLSDVVDFIKNKHEIEIQLDSKGLTDAAVDPSAPITRSVKGISLRSALRLILEEFDLTYVVQDEVLKITSKEKADEILTTRVYPVADLVIPVISMGGGMMGGMGGGMGGMGGMGGGGMGGMGGGMGGMGGGGMGGMGGGMGGGMFAVKDDLQTAAKPAQSVPSIKLKPATTAKPDSAPASTAPAAATTAPAAAQKPASVTKPAARIKLPAGADADTAWNDFFATHEEAPQAVRETVRQLTAEKKYADVVALILAALRNQQAQPWMYEALGLAMQADNRSLEDIDRTFMSAVDFVQGPEHMMYLAEYLVEVGLEKRALQLFKQLATAEPSAPRPFVNALRIAKKFDDVDAIKWSTVGILSLAWNEDEAAVWHEAYDMAAATLDRLRTENRQSEADEYQQKLDQSLIRDIVVVISYTGEADLDLIVEEPGGTVCSSRTPRTTGGGVLLGDGARRLDKKASVSHSESYVCPSGYEGVYRALIRRVWGKLATGKVTVDIYTHYLSKHESHIHKLIPLNDDEALIVFDLKGGRRTEPLAKQQLANAVAKQVHVSQQILGQQLAAAGNAGSLNSFLNSRGIGPAVGGAAFAPFFARGAVGYQPVITVLPSGAQMTVRPAVVSHDRRYVRVSPVPFFSGISQVNTFNYVTGSSGTSNGGSGGSSFGGGSGLGGTSGGAGGF